MRVPPHDDLVTIARLPTAGAAYAARGRLEAEGIAALVVDSDTLRLDPFRPQAHPGFRLSVRARDAERAMALLAEVPE